MKGSASEFDISQRAALSGRSYVFVVSFTDRFVQGKRTEVFRLNLFNLLQLIQKANNSEEGLTIIWPKSKGPHTIDVYDWLDGWFAEPRLPIASVAAPDDFRTPDQANPFFCIDIDR